MLLRKCVDPCEHMDNWKKFDENILSPKEAFYSNLSLDDISDEDYTHAQIVGVCLKQKILVTNMTYMFKVTYYCLQVCMKTLEICVLKNSNLIPHIFVTESWKQRKKWKAYVEALKEVFRNKVKESRENVVSDEERNAGIRKNVSYVNTVMDCIEKDSSEFGNFKAIFSTPYKDLLFSGQITSSGMVSPRSVVNTDTFASHSASNSSIKSTCVSADLSFDTQDEEILNIHFLCQCSYGLYGKR